MNFHTGPRRGFTLIELLVTIAIAATLMLIAAPSFTEFQRNSQLSSLTNTLMAAVNAARGEAMKRNMYAYVMPVDGANWSSGWQVFVDKDLSQSFTSDDEVVLVVAPPPSYITVSGTGTSAAGTPFIMFNGSGYPGLGNTFGNLTFTIARNDVTSNQQATQTRRLIIANSGRVRTCRPDKDSSCTASANQ